MNNIKTSLKNFNQSPGTCKIDEIVEVEKFIKEYIKIRDIYKSVYGNDPIGLTLEHKIDEIEFYKIHCNKNNH